ncbi:hypothetical protein [Rubinisphaera sp.]|uniref:hypothetical protein n=1 Tax=Rubinisphaera sp. TaxID=2024857 RepID=UPI0025DA540D|nr:hypothetical protein [Rubinisphaera sp.]
MLNTLHCWASQQWHTPIGLIDEDFNNGFPAARDGTLTPGAGLPVKSEPSPE